MSPYNPYFNLDVINEIVNQACTDPERLLSALGVDCRQQGKKFAGACPVHQGDNIGAFNFYPEGEDVRGIWFCRTHHCEQKHKKTLVGLVRGVKKCNWVEAVNWLLKHNGIKSINDVKLPDDNVLNKRKLNRAFHKLNVNNQDGARGWTRDWVRKTLEIPARYYIDRGYSVSILDKYDVGFYKPMNRVSVPVYTEDRKQCVGFAARSVLPKCSKCDMFHAENEGCPNPTDGLAIAKACKWRNSKDFEAANHLYNYWFAKEHISRDGVAILVEGPGDVWRLEENNIHISLGLFGSDLTDNQRTLLDASGALSLIVLTDNDEAGINAAKQLKKKLGRTYRMFFPQISTKDVGELHSDAITKDIEPFINQARTINGH